MTPAREAQPLEERHARRVVGEDEADQRAEAERRRPLEGVEHQAPADAATLGGGAHVDADLGGGRVRRSPVEVLQGQPADDGAVALQDPQRPTPRRVVEEPGASALDRYRLGVGGGAPAGDRLVVDRDDAGEVVRASVADGERSVHDRRLLAIHDDTRSPAAPRRGVP